MTRVPAKKLVPGMRLARPVLNKNGLVMIAEDQDLTGALIEKIQDMDTEAVYVHGAAKELPPREEALAQLDRRFSKVEALPHMALLKGLIAEHIRSLYEEHGSEGSQG